MIDIRLSKKAKAGAVSGSGRRSSGGMSTGRASYADYAATADEATHALSADEATHALEAEHALASDEAAHALEAEHALNADEATHALASDNSLLWDGHTFDDWLSQPLREGDNVTFAQVVASIFRSPEFVSGLLGEGFALETDGDISHLTVDRLTVRQAMVVMEMLTQRVRAVGGTLIVSAADGRIASVEDAGSEWLLTFETDHTFEVGDYLRCAAGARSWWAEATAVGNRMATVRKADCDTIPAMGGDVVLLGSKNINRQNAILISASEDGEPRIDVLGGIHTTSLAGCLRARLGKLDGIADAALTPAGVGLYSDNAYLRGEFVLSTGENVLTRFAITEGMITSNVQNIRTETAPSSCLANGMFMDGGESWVLASNIAPLRSSGKWMSVLGKFLAIPKKRTAWIADGSLWLDGGSALQSAMDYRPDEPTAVRVAVTTEMLTGGVLSISLGEHSESRPCFGGRTRRFETEWLWNGTGSFSVAYSGQCRILSCAVTIDRGATISERYATLFEQSDKLIKLSATNFADDGSVLAESSIAQTAERISATVADSVEGALRQTGIDIRTGEVTVSADMIHFTDSSGAEQALIKDGRVNAAAVDVNEVVVRDESNPEKCVEIKPDDGDVVIRDTGGRECQRLTGDAWPDAPDHFFGGSGSGSSDIIFDPNYGSQTEGFVMPVKREVMIYLSQPWSGNNVTEALWQNGTVTLTATAADTTRNYTEGALLPANIQGVDAMATILVLGFADEGCSVKVGEWTIGTMSVTANAMRSDFNLAIDKDLGNSLVYTGTSRSASFSLAGTSTKTTVGQYFRIAVRLTYTARYDGCTAKVSWGMLSAEAIAEAYASHFFANGFALGTSNKNFITVWNTDDEGMQLLMRNGDVGMRFTSSGLEVLKDGKWTKL